MDGILDSSPGDRAAEGDPRPVELVVFVGLQASGKGTFFRERFAATYAHVSKDLFPNNRNRNRRQAQLIEAALLSGSPVVVDNTNPTVEYRREIISLGRERGARIVGYYFDSGVRRCEGRARVPDVAIYATAKRLVPPSFSEGFDELFRVGVTGDGAFEVGPYAGRDPPHPANAEYATGGRGRKVPTRAVRGRARARSRDRAQEGPKAGARSR